MLERYQETLEQLRKKLANSEKQRVECVEDRTRLIQEYEDEARERDVEIAELKEELFVMKDADAAVKATLLALARMERKAMRYECMLLKAGIDPSQG